MAANAANTTFTREQVELIARASAKYAVDEAFHRMNLENRRGPDDDISERDNNMPKRLRERIIVNGKERWVTGFTRQELFDNYVNILYEEGIIDWCDGKNEIPLLKDYLTRFFSTYKQKQESNTLVNRERLIRNHILPALGNKKIDKIKTDDLQIWFNELDKKYARETILKLRNILNPVLDKAADEGLIPRNPLQSKVLEIGGKETVGHKALPKEKMEEIRSEIGNLQGKERLMASLLCFTAMRYEEILGLRWDDINDAWIVIQRAVVHPKRNQPEIKDPKTKTSNRIIPYRGRLKELLQDFTGTGFVLASDKDPTGETPLSYTEARRIFDKIRKRFDIMEYTAHDFRDTCATELRESGVPLDIIARLLGHAKTETTERKYVKYRPDLLSSTPVL